MSIGRRVTEAVGGVDNPSSPAARSRAARAAEFARRFPDVGSWRVLDLGGTSAFWRQAPVRPAHVTLLNIGADEADEPWLRVVPGDACDPPDSLEDDYDLVFSNSVIEHVGGHARREQFADVVRSRGTRYWVQTPYRYFPVEPHWLVPGMQFLPFRARVAVSRHWPVGHYAGRDPGDSPALVAEVELLTKTQLVQYFPDAEIWWDRFAGLPKSMVAVRS